MFDLLKSIFSGEIEAQEIKTQFAADDVRLAEAALMFHVIQADGAIVEDERARMNSILEEDFSLSSDQGSELFEAAKMAENEAVDLYRFTSLLKANLERDRLVQIVENLWEMVYADGKLHELEDNVVWRIAELLNVDSTERMALKRRVRDRVGI